MFGKGELIRDGEEGGRVDGPREKGGGCLHACGVAGIELAYEE